MKPADIILGQTLAVHLTGYGLALVNVHALVGVDVLQEASLTIERLRALLARMSPRLSNGGAAELPGADDPLQLAEALAVLDSPSEQTEQE